ncbi:hypothetical protein KDX01_20185 [Burkholderia vietnamiensis]|uniref:hypothetical protein n=1 Tax=Burkholderia vietnamiensis TaxID=60552 RepID=UPI001B969A7B|nr:hypothetical protein [Burkholderia vietnamiensis]MBR7975411.1 hypothetical protein [Burkholderia vietnamiensis]
MKIFNTKGTIIPNHNTNLRAVFRSDNSKTGLQDFPIIAWHIDSTHGSIPILAGGLQVESNSTQWAVVDIEPDNIGPDEFPCYPLAPNSVPCTVKEFEQRNA